MTKEITTWFLSNGAALSLLAGEPSAAGPALTEVTRPKARVVVVENPAAVVAFTSQLDVVRRMVDRGLITLTGKPTPTAAWHSLVSTQDIIGLKVLSAPGSLTGTRPAVAEAVLQSLRDAGLTSSNIVIWDKHYGHLKTAGFAELGDRYGVRVAGSAEAGYDTNHFYDSPLPGQLIWGDLEYGQQRPNIGRRSYVSRLVTQGMTKIVNLAPLLNHNLTGVSGHLYSLALGSVDNTIRFLNVPGELMLAVPDIYALPELGDRVVLNITDALVAQYYGEEHSYLHYASILSQLRFGTDPVALDVLSVRELERQRELADTPPVKQDLQLYHNAALIDLDVSDLRDIQVEVLK
jgi:hypothetical protein